MKSVKPGRGPSRRGAAGAVISIIWGVIWTALACGIALPAAGSGGFGMVALIFPLFGLCFIGMGVYNLLYHKRNAQAGVHERDSLLEIVDTGDDRARPDDGSAPSDAAFCPWCGERLGEDYQYCPKCGRKLP